MPSFCSYCYYSYCYNADIVFHWEKCWVSIIKCGIRIQKHPMWGMWCTNFTGFYPWHSLRSATSLNEVTMKNYQDQSVKMAHKKKSPNDLNIEHTKARLLDAGYCNHIATLAASLIMNLSTEFRQLAEFSSFGLARRLLAEFGHKMTRNHNF